jgi:hypothetical protein
MYKEATGVAGQPGNPKRKKTKKEEEEILPISLFQRYKTRKEADSSHSYTYLPLSLPLHTTPKNTSSNYLTRPPDLKPLSRLTSL